MPLWYSNPAAREWTVEDSPPSVRSFHRELPGYTPTPLVSLPDLALELGVGQLMVKDESSRLGLPAFKVLGAAWACHQVLDRSPGAELVTATDGNHGRAVARLAARFGTTATVLIPSVLLPQTATLIEREGATVVRIYGDYDATVRAAAEYASAAPGRSLVQDTSWPGYEQVPQWIVEGYDTLLAEVDETLGRAPDLLAVPVGVGSLAQAVVGHYRRGDLGRARVLSVEPDTAACLTTSLLAGRSTSVPTEATVMAGLNCGTVSSLAWPVLRDGCDAAITVTDDQAMEASDELAAHGVSSGACGAATLAGLRNVLHHPERREVLGLPEDAIVVLLSTEGRQP